ncbi:long-chain-fatty-acid-- ligase [Moniliophthora roreri MCA 2997]|uniref:Long-chain-fatty-acid--ligase n=1 Tax=Moniliophthora roreri (strain MCA 2997) TaxID=1381753 RepID=V2XWY9_MONRO|nr:long-chain-fatty-acid-- ligase [Moniliophthora roreri MCA 2997]
MASSWAPKRTLIETDDILCSPGAMHEMETRLVDGRLQRVYRNLWPSIRDFWLHSVSQYGSKTYIVEPERSRTTYQQVHDIATKAANLFYHAYGIRKGDRIAICSRNCVEYFVVFWASQLLGAVTVNVNAWLPVDPLRFCISHAECKLVVLDAERADRLQPIITQLAKDTGIIQVLVFALTAQERTRSWRGMELFDSALQNFIPVANSPISEIEIHPEDNAVIMFTSGTTGFPKGVLSTQRQFLSNAFNTVVGNCRAALRRGEDLSSPPVEGPQKGALVAVPLFHVTGLTSYSMMSTMLGYKIILMRKWIPEEGSNGSRSSELIKEENVGVAGGVPAMVQDLMDSSLRGHSLEGLFFGGSAAPDVLVENARKAFPSTRLSQGYGLTETNSIAVAIAGDDYALRPTSTGLPCPINDMIVMTGDILAPPGTVGEIWLRGANVMKGYWRDPEATSKVLTSDGWLKTGDIGMMDEEGFLYVKDRAKDIIIRGGENIASIAVENALYLDPRVMEAGAVGVPDTRLGELVAAVVSIKPAFRGAVTESSLIEGTRKVLPAFAVPVIIIVRDEPFELTPSGKIMKGPLRKIARHHWEERRRVRASQQANL